MFVAEELCPCAGWGSTGLESILNQSAVNLRDDSAAWPGRACLDYAEIDRVSLVEEIGSATRLTRPVILRRRSDAVRINAYRACVAIVGGSADGDLVARKTLRRLPHQHGADSGVFRFEQFAQRHGAFRIARQIQLEMLSHLAERGADRRKAVN
jgi:hypothetical protein